MPKMPPHNQPTRFHQVGFDNPRVIEAIKQQLDDLSFSTRHYTNRTAVALAKKLTELAPADSTRCSLRPRAAPMGLPVLHIDVFTSRLRSPDIEENDLLAHVQ